MKKKIQILTITLSLIFSTLAFSQATKTLTLNIKDISCALCASRIENAIKKVDGVQKCTVDNKAGKGTVEYTEGKATPDQIVEACNKSGFRCEL